MPDPKNLTNTKSASDDQQVKKPIATDEKKVTADAVPAARKEQGPIETKEANVLAEIQEKSKEADLTAEREIRKEIGKEAKLKEPEVRIPKVVAKEGVVSPEKEATKVLKEGPTIELPITEEKYKSAEKVKLTSKTTNKKEVYGVSGIIALCLYIGKLIKKAHHHAKKIVFKKSPSVETSEDKGK